MTQTYSERVMRILHVVLVTFVLFLLGVHFFGVIGLTIEEITPYIRYGQIVTWTDFMTGIQNITLGAFVSRLSVMFILRLIVVLLSFWLICVHPSGRSLKTHYTFPLIIFLMLGQIPFMDVPLEGIACLLRSGHVSQGIDGELFGEDWFSWAASDILLLVTWGVGMLLIGVKTLSSIHLRWRAYFNNTSNV